MELNEFILLQVKILSDGSNLEMTGGILMLSL
jgi:hypothetical protein